MSKYIDIESLTNYPIRIDHYDEEHGNLHFVLGIESVIEYAENLPTIEIVRCKECRHYNTMTNGCKRNPSVEPWGDNDFCSYGVMKGADDE